MPDQAPDSVPASASPAPTDADTLAALQQENAHLQARVDELLAAVQDASAQRDLLDQAERDNAALRTHYAAAALNQALAQAAANVGLSTQAAAAYAHRFQCQVAGDGEVRIEPNPTEFLLREVQDNPLLRQSLQRSASQRQARAVVNGAADVDQVDPVELLTALDRDPARKAQFIARHGSAAFIDLAARARAKSK